MIRKTLLAPLFLSAVVPLPTAAQGTDLTALMSEIDKSSGQYEQLLGILQGDDPNRAIAAFDAMLRSGDKTLIEVATNAGLAATDTRLRARALWETLSHKSALSIVIDTGRLDPAQKAAMEEWSGQVLTFPLYGVFPDLQCINLKKDDACAPESSVSVAGVNVDIRAGHFRTFGLNGQFTLDESGTLVGLVTDPGEKLTYPAKIIFR